MSDNILDSITQYIIKNYSCHTIILYGSHARGDENSSSDYDFLGIRDAGEFERDCHCFQGKFMDVFIYPEKMVLQEEPSLIRIKDGTVLVQQGSLGDDLLTKIKQIFVKGPSPTPAWEKHEINTWAIKMGQRSKQKDIEGNFRRHWLLHELLECYFKLRDMWFLGPKESFQWLLKNDLETYQAFDKALDPRATSKNIEHLINLIKTDTPKDISC